MAPQGYGYQCTTAWIRVRVRVYGSGKVATNERWYAHALQHEGASFWNAPIMQVPPWPGSMVRVTVFSLLGSSHAGASLQVESSG